MKTRRIYFSRSPSRRSAFVLLEVILSLAILGVAVAALMRSYAQSLNTARRMQVHTQALFLAQQLLDEFEIYTPLQGKHEGGFGDAYRAFSYTVNMEYEEPSYRRVKDDDIGQYFSLRHYVLKIHYDDGIRPPSTPVSLETAVINFEKFSLRTKQSYAEY
jgi:type II secretion system protein I